MEKKLRVPVLLALLAFFSVYSIVAQVITGNVDDYGVYTLKSVSGELYLQVAGDTLYNEKYKDQALIVGIPLNGNTKPTLKSIKGGILSTFLPKTM